MNETIFTIIKYTVGILSLVIFRYVIPYAKLKLDNTKYKNVIEMIEKGINAAETIFKGLEKSGEEKKQFVIDYVTRYASEHNIKISKEQIVILLEAIFNELDGITVNKRMFE